LSEQLGADALTSYDAVARRAEIVLLCHERAQLDEIAASVSPGDRLDAWERVGLRGILSRDSSGEVPMFEPADGGWVVE
jgi:hypothetical protein